MKVKTIYDAVSRVVSNDCVIGFMVSPQGKKKEVYLSLDALSFGLSQGNFEIRNVKLGNNGKPRGYNGFLLSKLPIVSLDDEKAVSLRLYKLLVYLLYELGYYEDISKIVKYDKVGVTLSCSATFYLEEFKDMNKEVAKKEFLKNVKFYQKHLPKGLKEIEVETQGDVDDKGQITLTLSSQMIKGGSEYEKL